MDTQWILNGAETMADAPGQLLSQDMTPEQQRLLTRWATRYVWWKTPAEALKHPERIIAQVMDIGDYDDVQQMMRAFGEDSPRYVVQHAEAGMFSPRSWAYWNYRLRLAAPGQVPPLPRRFSNDAGEPGNSASDAD